VPPDKRHEFVQSAHELMRDERSHLQRVLLLQDRQEANIFCWMGDGSGTQAEGVRELKEVSRVSSAAEKSLAASRCVLHDTAGHGALEAIRDNDWRTDREETGDVTAFVLMTGSVGGVMAQGPKYA
jgi:hypothetical protein